MTSLCCCCCCCEFLGWFCVLQWTRGGLWAHVLHICSLLCLWLAPLGPLLWSTWYWLLPERSSFTVTLPIDVCGALISPRSHTIRSAIAKWLEAKLSSRVKATCGVWSQNLFINSSAPLCCQPQIKMEFSWVCSSGAAHILRYYVMIICLPFLPCQPFFFTRYHYCDKWKLNLSSSLHSISFSPLSFCSFCSCIYPLHGSLYFLICFNPLNPPIHLYIHTSIHPFPLRQIQLSLCLEAEKLPISPERQTPIQAAGGGPAAVSHSLGGQQREKGVDTWRGSPLFRNSLFSSSVRPVQPVVSFELVKVISPPGCWDVKHLLCCLQPSDLLSDNFN